MHSNHIVCSLIKKWNESWENGTVKGKEACQILCFAQGDSKYLLNLNQIRASVPQH